LQKKQLKHKKHFKQKKQLKHLKQVSRQQISFGRNQAKQCKEVRRRNPTLPRPKAGIAHGLTLNFSFSRQQISFGRNQAQQKARKGPDKKAGRAYGGNDGLAV
jgi:hypothetical protein